MADVLILAFDDTIRASLHDILRTVDHYDVVEVTMEADALIYLAAHPESMIVVVSNRDADHHRTAAFFAQVVALADVAARHQFILLSTNEKAISSELQAHLAQLGAAVLPKPIDLDALLASVREAAVRLAARQAGVPNLAGSQDDLGTASS